MLKNCAVLFRIGARDMSKKFKSETLKITPQKQTESGNLVNQNSHACKGEIDNDIDQSKPSFTRFPSHPVKSPNDKKVYSVIKLENGITALLISDTYSSSSSHVVSDLDNEENEIITDENISTESEGSNDDAECMNGIEEGSKKEEKLAACSLTVGVGSFNDPQDVPGMAHFVEHMLFMGSKKYPEENFLDSYIKKLGGSNNASTECESTNFYFECPDENLSKAMDVFSNLFVSPMMTKSAMLREREAVESEFIQNKPNDHYRHQQILMACAAPGNPSGKFVWGNLKTLKENVTDDNLYDATHLFWKTHYSSHKMTVAVQARLPVDIMERMVAKHFSKVPLNDTQLSRPEWPETPFLMNSFNKVYYVESVKDNIILELSWVMPPVKHLFITKPTNYLSWTIGHEGRGSLMSYLRKKHWAISLTAGHDDDDLGSNKIYSIFSISIALTELGANNLESILRAVFSYIKMLQINGPLERIFKELQKIADLNFRFEEESQAAEYVEALSGNMQIYPIVNYINGNELLFEYSPESIKKFLNCLSPATVNITLSRKQHDENITLNYTEPWFTTKYTSKPIPDDWMKAWVNEKVYPEFHLPEPNEFIASDFSLCNKGGEGPKYPEKILSSNALSLWYKADTQFKLPTAFIGFQFINKNTYESLLDNSMLKMYTELLNHLLTEELYPSTMALLEYKIMEYDGCLLIEVYGFNEKLHIILDKIADYITQFNEIVTEEVIEMYKEARLKAYYNNNFQVANLSREIRLKITLEKSFTSAEKYNVTPNITLELMKKFSDDFYKNVHIQCLVQGNLRRNETLTICTNFVNKLLSSVDIMAEKPPQRVYKLLNTEQCCRIKSFNNRDVNSVTINYYQFGDGTIKTYCIIDLLMLLMEEPLFDKLRTQEQLGYDVSCSIREMYGIIGFTVNVVSQLDKQSLDHIEERVTAFLNNYLETLKNMPLSEFNRVVKSLIALKQCCDLHLKEEVSRNWGEIKCFDYAFDRLELEQKYLSKLTPPDVINFLQRSIEPTNPNFRKLTVQVEGCLPPSNEKEQEELENHPKQLPPTLQYTFLTEVANKERKYVITDFNDFQSQLTFYPENKLFKK